MLKFADEISWIL